MMNMPAVCFLAGRRLWGLAGGICLALAWNGGGQVVRRLLGKPLSGLLIIGLLELVLRASVALALKSTQAFFIAPAIVTAVTGVVYIGSGFTSTPLVGKVLADLVPESMLDVNDPRLAVLLRKGSLLYGAEQLLIAVVSLVMVVNLSTTVYVAVHSLVSWVLLGLMAAVVTPFLLGEVRAAGPPGACGAGGRLLISTSSLRSGVVVGPDSAWFIMGSAAIGVVGVAGLPSCPAVSADLLERGGGF